MLPYSIFCGLAICAICWGAICACGFWELYLRNSVVPDVENENNDVELQTISMYEQPNPCHTNTSLEGLVNLKEKEKSTRINVTNLIVVLRKDIS